MKLLDHAKNEMAFLKAMPRINAVFLKCNVTGITGKLFYSHDFTHTHGGVAFELANPHLAPFVIMDPEENDSWHVYYRGQGVVAEKTVQDVDCD